MHVLASGVTRMLVVVCRSFCACRQTSCLSFVKVTSHSRMPAPSRAPASYDSLVCSGNCRAAPRWPIEKSLFLNGPAVQLLQLAFERPVFHLVDEKERTGTKLHARVPCAGGLRPCRSHCRLVATARRAQSESEANVTI